MKFLDAGGPVHPHRGPGRCAAQQQCCQGRDQEPAESDTARRMNRAIHPSG